MLYVLMFLSECSFGDPGFRKSIKTSNIFDSWEEFPYLLWDYIITELSESVKMATASQKLILEGDTLAEQKKDLYEDAAKVVVSMKSTYEVRYCHT